MLSLLPLVFVGVDEKCGGICGGLIPGGKEIPRASTTRMSKSPEAGIGVGEVGVEGTTSVPTEGF